MVKELIAKGANVNAADAGGWTPLILAAYHGQATTVESLIAAGADVNARTKKTPPL